jgi:hypothetical protein
MRYEPPFSRVIALKLETGFLTSGMDDELDDNTIEPVDYEPL